MGQKKKILRKRLAVIDLFGGLRSVGTLFATFNSASLGPSAKKLATGMSPSSTVHGDQYDPKYVEFEYYTSTRSYCVRHLWWAKFGAIEA